ncbi:hypothetical protein GCM10027047_01280 [Rhodococcus aerolatus]
MSHDDTYARATVRHLAAPAPVAPPTAEHLRRCDHAAERALLISQRVWDDDPAVVRTWLDTLDRDALTDALVALAAMLPQDLSLSALLAPVNALAERVAS